MVTVMLLLTVTFFSVVGITIQAPILEQGIRAAIPAGMEVSFKEMDPSVGTYEFGYDTGVGLAQSYRYENRTSDGIVHGKYGYITPDGILREVHYVADAKGFRTFLIDRYPVRMPKSSFIGPIPSRLNFT